MVLFKEEQVFSKWITIPTAILMGGTAVAIVLSDFQNENYNTAIKLVLSLLPLCIALLMFVAKLSTCITADYIEIRYFPFVKRKWYWKNIMKPKVFDYGFIGGWGIRLWTGYGTVYNTKGSMGLHFKVKSTSKTKEYIIGTQRHQELQETLEQIKFN